MSVPRAGYFWQPTSIPNRNAPLPPVGTVPFYSPPWRSTSPMVPPLRNEEYLQYQQPFNQHRQNSPSLESQGSEVSLNESNNNNNSDDKWRFSWQLYPPILSMFGESPQITASPIFKHNPTQTKWCLTWNLSKESKQQLDLKLINKPIDIKTMIIDIIISTPNYPNSIFIAKNIFINHDKLNDVGFNNPHTIYKIEPKTKNVSFKEILHNNCNPANAPLKLFQWNCEITFVNVIYRNRMFNHPYFLLRVCVCVCFCFYFFTLFVVFLLKATAKLRNNNNQLRKINPKFFWYFFFV